MNQHVRPIIREAKTYIGTPYKLGGLSHNGIDCRGLIRRASGNAGDYDCKPCYGGALGNVRQFVASARARGFYHEVALEPLYRPKRADAIVWASTIGGGKGPENLQHIGFYLRPVSAAYPKGLAISALVPKCRTHGLELRTLKIHGYIEPDWSLARLDAPAPDPEPPLEEDPNA